MQKSNRNRSRVMAAQGSLSLLAFTLMLGVAARAVQPQVDPSQTDPETVVLQESQQPPGNVPPESGQSNPNAEKTAVFTGTITRDGSNFVLRDEAGKVFRLDEQDKAEPFEGKPVKVTGKLEEYARLIHVDRIEEIRA